MQAPTTAEASPAIAIPRSGPTRTRLVNSAVALVEDLCDPGLNGAAPEAFSPRFQVCLPYRGLFVWHVHGEAVLGDPNQVLFVTGGESFRLTQPARCAYAELIVTPSAGVLRELLDAEPSRWRASAAFARRSRRVDPSLQFAAARLRAMATSDDGDPLALDEQIVALLRQALAPTRQTLPTAATRRLVDRTKAFLHAHGTKPLRLTDIARAVDATGPYLTDVFRRVEGVSLHRYLVQLRLACALVELPHTGNLSTLAMALGFSSHSHFAAAFRAAYGATPSAFRRLARSAN